MFLAFFLLAQYVYICIYQYELKYMKHTTNLIFKKCVVVLENLIYFVWF